MASHFRLRVLLPVAVLGLLGLGVGAFAFGRGPVSGGGDTPGLLPPLTGPATTTPAPRSSAELAVWAKKADSWCAGVNSTLAKLEPPKTTSDLEVWLGKIVRIQAGAAAAFPKLGYPKGYKAAVVRLQVNLRQSALASQAAFRALRETNQYAFTQALNRWGALDTNWQIDMRHLGALVCATDSPDVSSARSIAKYGSAGAALNAGLLHKHVVVVLFYAPGDDYDTIQTREARAGALDAGAGFLALDVTKNDQVAALAAQYDVREAPATLVFIPGPKVFYRIAGFLDRQSVAQAATDARTR
jgi:hypothetical protein